MFYEGITRQRQPAQKRQHRQSPAGGRKDARSRRRGDGNFLVVGLGSEDFASLSNELVAKYKDYFGVPEIFLKVNGKLHILPASPKE